MISTQQRPPARQRGLRGAALGGLALVAVACLGAAPAWADADVPPQTPPATGADPFYDPPPASELRAMDPGAVVRTRSSTLHLAGLPLPVRATQLLYRTSSGTGEPEVTATTVLRPPVPAPGGPRVVSYQSAYDALRTECQPSTVLAGGPDPGRIVTVETTTVLAPLLSQGYTVVTSDFEGQTPAFLSGRQYGIQTLDGIRAALGSRTDGLSPETPVGLLGYSGGSVATEWAAELAPDVAPDVDRVVVGSALGGVPVNLRRVFDYIDGSPTWSSILPMALNGLGRTYPLGLEGNLSERGTGLLRETAGACITEVLGDHPGLHLDDLFRPGHDPRALPGLRAATDQLIMGRGRTPTGPLFVRQASDGSGAGADQDKPGIGPGDGVTITGDVRTLARTHCTRNRAVDYGEYPRLGHEAAVPPFLAEALPWLATRFAGLSPTGNCGSIPPGNPAALDPAGP
ncbi:triacylglycerol lipase [Pseudonocardia sp. ICBG1122]|nr:triacylglycerol lipase [Pseudonocardia pini]